MNRAINGGNVARMYKERGEVFCQFKRQFRKEINKLKAILLLALLVSVLNGQIENSIAGEDSGEQTALAGVEKFKRLLSDSPYVRELIFIQRQYPDIKPKNTDTGGWKLVTVTNPTYFVTWQNDSFFMKFMAPSNFSIVNSRGETEKPDLYWSCGYSPGEMWWRSGEQEFTYYKGDLQNKAIGLSVHDRVRTYRNIALEAIYMGIRDLRPGSIKWFGNFWEGKTSTDQDIKGELQFDPKRGTPILMRYNVADIPNNFRVEYNYDRQTSDNGSGLPSRFRRIQESFPPTNNEFVVEAEFEILKMDISDVPLNKEIKTLANVEKSAVESLGIKPIFNETTNRTFYTDHSHRQKMVQTGPVSVVPPGSPTKKRQIIRLLLLIMFLTGISGVFYTIWRRPVRMK